MDEPRQQNIALAHQKVFNLTLASVMAQVGVLTVVALGIALLIGLALDSHYGTRPLWTIVCVVLSIPVTIGGMLWIVRRASQRFKQQAKTQQQ